ncbi:MAG: Carboxypeptidase regulatory-like domain [Fibrobacterota bacterium]
MIKPWIFLGAMLLWGCGTGPVAGGSTDTETGAVAGFATRLDGRPVAGATILAFRADSTASAPALLARKATAAPDGSYRLDSLSAGRWTFEFIAPDGYRGLAPSVLIHAGKIDTPHSLLHTPARIRLKESTDTTTPWVAGTAHQGRLVAGFWVVDSVPAGAPLVVRRGLGSASQVVARLVLAPSQDSLLP